MKKDNLFVSVIIPCRNEEHFIGKCLDSIIENDFSKDNMEVFVVDGASQDRTREIVSSYVKKYPFIRLLDNPKRIIPVAMNIGIKNVKGEIIMKIDSHAVYQKDYISKCVDYLLSYNADNVGGIVKVLPRENNIIGNAIVSSISSVFGVGRSLFRLGCKEPTWADTAFSGCYRRDVFDKVGLYDENIARSEDVAINSKLIKKGGKILLCPDIATHYYARSTFSDFTKHNFDNGFWVTYPLKFNTALFSWRHLIPLIFVSSLVVSGAAAFLFPALLSLFLLIIGSYMLANIYFSAKVSLSKKDIRYFFIMPVVFSNLHIGYGLGSLWGLLKAVNIKKAVKRLFDITLSLAGLIILSPLLLLTSVLIKIEDRGPVFYRGIRVGRGAVLFKIFKFRSMVTNAEKIGSSSTSDDDKRITKIGGFLRKYKLDELPQLINVLRGEMSLVGPRPQVEWAVKLYTDEEKNTLLSIKPGITDYASVKFRNEGEILKGSKDPDKDYMEKIHPEKMRLAMEYAKDMSFKADLNILLMTVLFIFKKEIKMSEKQLPAEATLRSGDEHKAAKDYARIFDSSPDNTETKLKNFAKYIRRQDATRFLSCYEIFKKALEVKGSVVECGVYRGFTLMSWALFSSVLEPANLTRRIYGFDTFQGFPSVSSKDQNKLRITSPEELSADSFEELSGLIGAYDKNRFLGHVKKMELVKGKAEEAIPKFIEDNPHLMISLLFLDFDLYEPTKTAIENFYPRIPKGGIIAFDELDNPIWPGETTALLESLGIGGLKIQRVPFDPYIGYAIKE